MESNTISLTQNSWIEPPSWRFSNMPLGKWQLSLPLYVCVQRDIACLTSMDTFPVARLPICMGNTVDHLQVSQLSREHFPPVASGELQVKGQKTLRLAQRMRWKLQSSLLEAKLLHQNWICMKTMRSLTTQLKTKKWLNEENVRTYVQKTIASLPTSSCLGPPGWWGAARTSSVDFSEMAWKMGIHHFKTPAQGSSNWD